MSDDNKYETLDRGFYGRDEMDRADALADAAGHYADCVDLRDLINSIPIDRAIPYEERREVRIAVGPYQIKLWQLSALISQAAELAGKEVDAIHKTEPSFGAAFRHEDTLDSDGRPRRGRFF